MSYQHSIGDAMNVAKDKSGMHGWHVATWKAADGGDSIVTGLVPDGVYLRGPRKGEPRLDRAKDGTRRTIVVTIAELDAAAKAYEQSTGKCYHCKGNGQKSASWSATHGTRYCQCQQCGGSGDAPNALGEVLP